MKVLCHSSDLIDAVSKASKAISSRTTNPILECIKLKAEGDKLTITANDLELGIEKTIRADVKIEGEAVVLGKYFGEYVKSISTDQIELTSANNQLRVNFRESQADFACFNVEEFPALNNLSIDQFFSVSKRDFKDLINKVEFSVATDDARPILRGILFEIKENVITAVSLDGYRLAKSVKKINSELSINIVVSGRAMNEIAKLIDDKDENINVYIEKNYLMVEVDSTKIVVRLLIGDFIDYRRIMPRETETTVTVNRKELEKVLSRASLVARADRNNMIKLSIIENKMEILSNSEVGNSFEKLDISADGKDLKIAFNGKYLTDCLSRINDEFINFKFSGGVSPCLIVPTDYNEEYLYLILPIRLQ